MQIQVVRYCQRSDHNLDIELLYETYICGAKLDERFFNKCNNCL